MQNSKLIRLLKSLKPAEFRELKDIIYTPYFNKNENIILFFEALKNFYPVIDQNELNDENINKKIYNYKSMIIIKFKNLIRFVWVEF